MAHIVRAAFDQGQIPTIACINKATVSLGVDFDKLIAALEGASFKGPAGDFAFDRATHSALQDIYIREVKTQNGQTVNTITDKVAKVTDPGK